MPVPIMLAITIQNAVKKPIVRRGVRGFTKRGSVTVTISESTIPKFSGLANSFEVAFKFMIGCRVAQDAATCWSQWENSLMVRVKAESQLGIFLGCQKPFPASR